MSLAQLSPSLLTIIILKKSVPFLTSISFQSKEEEKVEFKKKSKICQEFTLKVTGIYLESDGNLP